MALILAVPLVPAVTHADTPIAKVAGRTITVEELQKTLNSTPYGMPSPNTPTPAGRELMLKMLAEIISAELLHGEAVSLDIAATEGFKTEAGRYRKSMLADMYRKKLFAKAVIDDAEALKKYAKENSIPEEAAQALLQNKKRKTLVADESARLFDLYKVQYSPSVAKDDINKFKDDHRLVSSSAFDINYGDIKNILKEFGNTKNGLLSLLAQSVELELFAAEAKGQGMDKNPSFIADMADFEKNLLIASHRENLNKTFLPRPEETKDFLSKNRYLRVKPRTANVLMVVTNTEKEAANVRKKVQNGGNFYEMAIDVSIAPDAKVTAGRVNPIVIGEHPYTSIDKALLALKPGEISKPIKGDKGYSIFKLMDISPKEARSDSEMKEYAVRAITGMKMAKHIEKLRQSAEVELYPAIKEMGSGR